MGEDLLHRGRDVGGDETKKRGGKKKKEKKKISSHKETRASQSHAKALDTNLFYFTIFVGA